MQWCPDGLMQREWEKISMTKKCRLAPPSFDGRVPLTIFSAAMFLSSVLILGCDMSEPPPTATVIPPSYANKHMPEGWWMDQGVIKEGKALYLGRQQGGVNCAKCHGQEGKPVKSGARDFRSPETMGKYSDSHLLWRIAEGVPYSSMSAYKGRLTEQEIWKIIAFISTFGMSGYQYDPAQKTWVPLMAGEGTGSRR